MTVVSGISIDKKEDEYVLSFEIYNLQQTISGEPIESKILESTGKTIFDAVRNAKKRVSKKLYFSDAKIIIVSEKIAKEDGIDSIIDWFIRDPEIRETLELVVSQEETAATLLKTKGLTSTIVSSDIQNIIKKDQLVTSTTENISLYEIYNILNSEGLSLTLPAVHLIDNNDQKVCEVNGIAVFKNSKLVNYLTSEESKYYLLAKGELKGGIITINTKLRISDTDSQNISFEIKDSSASQKYISQEVGNFEVKISTNTKVAIGEIKDKGKKLSDEDLTTLEEEASKIIKERIENVISIIQKDYDTDILGYGKTLHYKNPKLWKKINENFNDYFKDIKTTVESKLEIFNTGFLK